MTLYVRRRERNKERRTQKGYDKHFQITLLNCENVNILRKDIQIRFRIRLGELMRVVGHTTLIDNILLQIPHQKALILSARWSQGTLRMEAQIYEQ